MIDETYHVKQVFRSFQALKLQLYTANSGSKGKTWGNPLLVTGGRFKKAFPILGAGGRRTGCTLNFVNRNFVNLNFVSAVRPVLSAAYDTAWVSSRRSWVCRRFRSAVVRGLR
jgi:hypothetical protein